MNIKNLLSGVIDLKELLNYYDATLIYDDLPQKIYGFVFNYDAINFIIINKNLSYYKKKKTIIHELAHIELNQLCQIDKDLLAFHIQDYEDDADEYIKSIKEQINN